MSIEELDSAMDSILGTNNQEDIWKDIKTLKCQGKNKFFFLEQNTEHRFRLLGPALSTERIYLPLNVYRQLVGPGTTSEIVSKKDIPSIKLLLTSLFSTLPYHDKLHIQQLQEMKDIIAFLYINRSHKACQIRKNEINALYSFLNNDREGWQKCTLINAVSICKGFSIKILPLIQTLKRSIKDIITRKPGFWKINGICAKDIIIKKSKRNEGRNNGRDIPSPGHLGYWINTPPAAPLDETTSAYTYSTNIQYNINVRSNPEAISDNPFNTESAVSFSDKTYFLPDNIIEYIVREGLWDIRKIIEASNREGQHVFYYRTQDDYKMPKEYMKELMGDIDDKMEQDCLDGIEDNMDDLPEDAMGNKDRNNSMSNLKLNFNDEE